ncbi:hypothetical protein JCM30760_21310 [Thiomicrorhabdus hydrogeniphila]
MSDVINNVPELRFSGFNDFWRAIPFGDIYSFSATNSLSRASLNDTSGEYKNIHYGDIHTKFSTMLDAKNASIPYITDFNELSNSHAKSHCEVGDLVFADASEDYADVGKAIQIISLPFEPLVSGLHTFLAKDNYHQTALGYSGYLMSSYKVRRQIMTMAVGAKVLGISKTNLAKVLLDIPCKEEQQKIADFLSSVDKKIEQLTEKHRLLTEYKKGVMQQIFTQQIRFKDNQGNDYPDWVGCLLGDHFEVGSSKRVLQEDWVSRGIPFLRTRELVSLSKKQPFSSEIFISPKLFKELSDKYGAPVEGDFLVSGVGTLGIHYQVKASDKFYFKDGNVLWLKRKPTINAGFFNFSFQSDFVQSQIVAQASTTTVGTFTIQNAKKTKLLIPKSLEEQQKIANFLTEIDHKIDQARATLEQTKAFKKGLLQKMFV